MATEQTHPESASTDTRARTPIRVAVLGLGAMGARMARRLLDGGFVVTVYNRSSAPMAALIRDGARGADSPRAAAEGADVVLSMVTDDEASRAVWQAPGVGAVHGLRAGAIAIESSTVTAARVAELDHAVRTRGATLLDAPVAGSRPQAEAGALIHLVGGPSAALEAVRPLLEAVGQRVVHIGAVGTGAAAKLAVNAFFAAQVAAFAEAVALMVRGGVERRAAIEHLSALPVTAPAIVGIGRLMAAGAHDPLFPIDLVAKDLRYASAGVGSAQVIAAVGALFERARRSDLGSSNISAIARLYDER